MEAPFFFAIFGHPSRGVSVGVFSSLGMIFVDFDRINADKFYDKVDENGVDVRLPPSELSKPFVYKQTSLNEALVKFQQWATKSYTKLENDMIAATSLYLSVKQTSNSKNRSGALITLLILIDLQEKVTTDLPRIVPELSSVVAMGTLAYLRHPQRHVLARLGISTIFAIGTTIAVFPDLRNKLACKTFKSLLSEVQSGLEDCQKHYQTIIVQPLVTAWSSTERSFYKLKETLFK